MKNRDWAQPGYASLPHVALRYPIIVSSDDPDVVCLVVYDIESRKYWMLVVDTMSKGAAVRYPPLRSAVPPCTGEASMLLITARQKKKVCSQLFIMEICAMMVTEVIDNSLEIQVLEDCF